MTILAGDIKLVASQVMDDIATGGGAPTSTVIQDGTSNSIFNDISELDRAGGRVNLRKVFASVQTLNTDTYLGANVIVAEAPGDPNVSVTIFEAESTFDRRSDARNRIESYLNKSSLFDGYLLENHVTGQRSIQIFHRESATLPAVGKTIYLVANEGLGNEYSQYVRITDIATQVRDFTHTSGGEITDYKARVTTLSLSDALAHDFPGSPPARTYTQVNGKSIVRDTIVADAAQYYGATATKAAISLGDVSANVDSIFTKLVPSTQTETALVDRSMTGSTVPLVPAAASAVTRTVPTAALPRNGKYFLPTGCKPGSLVIAIGGFTVTDDGTGALFVSGSALGTIDYATGELSFGAAWPTGLSGSVTESYIPSAPVSMQAYTTNRPVTEQSRSFVWVIPLNPPPAPGSVVVSFMAQGNWYDLEDNGLGVVSGTDSSYGVGTVSFTTGTLNMTLGALPDVGSSIVVSWGTPNESILLSTASLAIGSPQIKFDGGEAITPGTFTVNWTAGGVAKSATDNGSGTLTGDATGSIFYGTGSGYFATAALPDSSAISMTYQKGGSETYGVIVPEATVWSGTLPNAPIKPKSVVIELQIATVWTSAAGTGASTTPAVIRDNGSGALVLDGYGPLSGSSISYTTGAITVPVNIVASGPVPQYATVPAFNTQV